MTVPAHIDLIRFVAAAATNRIFLHSRRRVAGTGTKPTVTGPGVSWYNTDNR
ncbi:hypothetical protein HMPREF3033_01576 [Veillonellaceae bacterium DNF00751]|nr:hypothetical protein HMPREF3033_01576 [Veillonellaceae bacterium DNF00751]